MTYDDLVPAALRSAALCVSCAIAILLIGDWTGLYETAIGSALTHWIYDYPVGERHDLARYHEAEGDALFALLAAPMLLVLALSTAYYVVIDIVKRYFRIAAVPAE